MKKSKKPVFKVIYNQFGRGIQFENIFEFGQVESMLAELKKLKKKLNAAYAKKELNGDDDAFRKIVNRLFWDEKKRIKKYTPDELIEIELRRKCQYYFWAKCEYEVIVTGWPDTKTERKIDIYDQLDANWETFKKMVFEVIG
ncbi:MAG: hypothetical protein IKN15_01395 [Bacteroidaceae bacterium]|nr:hypothetical protein [Bacteroidaceae bacterium]